MGVFPRGVPQDCFIGRRPEANLRNFWKSYFYEILVLADKPPKGPAQPDSSSEISAEDGWPRRPCGQLGVLVSNDDVGQTSSPRVSEPCFKEVVQTPWLERPPLSR